MLDSKSFPPALGAGRIVAAAVCGLAGAASAQTAATAPDATPPVQRVEITGERNGGDLRERRESTVAKTVVGREEIERFGDATLGEVLKRLPGVTLDGPPGRGGSPRLRGLGNGYTQILLDGEAVPAGFDIESLAPEQVERIEILRAPTAETGARAIAGTINIITRQGSRRRQSDLRLALGLEDGRWSPTLNWTRSGSDQALSYTFTLNASNPRSSSHLERTLSSEEAGVPTLLRQETADGSAERRRLGLNGRLQWRLGEGESFTLTPVAFYTENDGRSRATLQQLLGSDAAPYALADADSHSRFALGRITALRTMRLEDGTRLEWRASIGHWQSDDGTLRTQRDAGGALLRTLDDSATITDTSWNAGLKASTLLADAHSGVAGLEVEQIRREERRSNLRDGVPLFTAFGDSQRARSLRLAAYAQDEWEINKQWGAHLGLRWESIETSAPGQADTPANRSMVWSPLLHALWKPDAQSRDQLRLSLTRSYRALALGRLIGRPVPSALGLTPNSPTNPDRAGNPALRPELATGLDATFEHYLEGGGLLSAGVFQRDIRDLVRNEVSFEAASGRWVNRPYNVGDATVRGLELEARFALRQLLPDAPAVDLRASSSFYRSRVQSVPGPDNRVDSQPGMTASLGADWKLRALPLALGASLAWTPGYTTRLSATEVAVQGRKPVFDAYALWTFNPALALRLTASNLTTTDYLRSSSVSTATGSESLQTLGRTYVDWMLRVEMKL